MTQNQILDDTLKAISKYLTMDKHIESIIKLILENLMLSAKIEMLKEINEEK